MKTVLQWLSWAVSCVAFLLFVLGIIAYLFGCCQSLFGVKWGTYYFFSGNFFVAAILLVLLYMACKDKKE